MTSQRKPAPITPGLATRFGAVRGYFIDRVGVKHYMPVFVAIEPELAEHATLIQQWWNAKRAVLMEHEPVIARMERVVEVLKNAKSLAA